MKAFAKIKEMKAYLFTPSKLKTILTKKQSVFKKPVPLEHTPKTNFYSLRLCTSA
jgi:hypothetical protein